MLNFFLDHETLLQAIAINALLALSIQVPLRAGALSLGGIGFYAIGSYTSAKLATEGHSMWVSIGGALLISAVVGWILARVLFRLRGLYLGMATMAFDLMVGVVALNWTGVTGGAAGMFGIPPLIGTAGILIALVVVLVILTAVESGVLGRTFEASREDEQLAQALAIDTTRARRFALVLSALLGGLAGSLYSLTSFAISPTDAGFHLVVLGLAMVILGGYVSWAGAIIGAAIVTSVPLVLGGIGEWWPVIYGGAIVVIATYSPTGLLGLIKSGTQYFRKKRSTGSGVPAGTQGLVK